MDRSGKTGGDGEEACFNGRKKKHAKNATTLDQMKEHEFYTAEYNIVSLGVVLRPIARNGGRVSVRPGTEAFGLRVNR